MTIRVTIFGAGAWGTALATAACRAGASPLLWDRSQALCQNISTHHQNPRLPGLLLDPRLRATSSLPEALSWGQHFLLAIPAQSLRGFLLFLQPFNVSSQIPFIIASKGIEKNTGLLMHEIGEETFPEHPFIILSGPNLAHEVAKGLPTAVTLASRQKNHGQNVAKVFESAHFRTHLTTDIIGAQVGGALKNVIAIACGLLKGQGLGENATALLITRGLAEITRFGLALGASCETFLGLCGLGDLVLTCNSEKSRNTAFGMALGRGVSVKEASPSGPLVEGAVTVFSVLLRSKTLGISMPISEATSRVLKEEWTLQEATQALLGRPFSKEEFTPTPFAL